MKANWFDALLVTFLSALVFTVGVIKVCEAGYVPSPMPLGDMVEEAYAIVIAEVKVCVPDSRYRSSSIPDDLDELGMLGPAGIYTFEVRHIIKGKAPSQIKVGMPQVLNFFYDLTGSNIDLRLRVGSIVLLMLKQGASGEWNPVDSRLPMIPLATNITSPDWDKEGASISDRVVTVLLSSLEDRRIRRVVTYILRMAVDPRIPSVVAKYDADLDLRTRGSVLFMLAVNGQLAAIPKIAELEDGLFENDNGTQAVEALALYKTPEAVSWLNPLMLQRSPYIRINTTFALARLADRSSIPHLILASDDPDATIAYYAYCLLHKLVRGLGPVKQLDYFEGHREPLVTPLYSWWRDELSGKHPQPAQTFNKQKVEEALREYVRTDLVPFLITLLYDTKTTARIDAIKGLQDKPVDRRVIPYLMLALKDPEPAVVYEAYSILHRLIDSLGPAKTRDEFQAHMDKEIAPICAWWNDELSGKHIREKQPSRQPG